MARPSANPWFWAWAGLAKSRPVKAIEVVRKYCMCFMVRFLGCVQRKSPKVCLPNKNMCDVEEKRGCSFCPAHGKDPMVDKPNFKQVRLTQARFLALARSLLAEGLDLQFTVTGKSMRPFLMNGDEVVVTPSREPPAVGAMVMVWEKEQGLMIHRVIWVGTSQEGQMSARLAGDGLFGHEVEVECKDIVAVVVSIQRDGVLMGNRPLAAMTWRCTRWLRQWMDRIRQRRSNGG
jgi:hypothetical protein